MARQARATRLARGHDISRVPLREIRELSVDGLPRLMWTDEFPTGLTKGMLLDRWEFRFHTGAIIVCAVIGLFVQGLPGLLGGAVIGAFLGGLARRNADPPDLRLPLTGNVAAPKKRQPSELELRLEAEHETVQEDCEAYLVEHNGELWFVIERGDRPRGQTRAQALPWESDAFGNFEEGDFSDWFRSPAKYSPVRGDRVVVIQPRGKAPVLVCHWAHEAAFTRHLRERLEEAFAGRARAELLERRRLLKQDVLAKGSTSPLATPDVQEIPKSL